MFAHSPPNPTRFLHAHRIFPTRACYHGGEHSRVGVQVIDACLVESGLSKLVSESSCATDGTEKSYANLCGD